MKFRIMISVVTVVIFGLIAALKFSGDNPPTDTTETRVDVTPPPAAGDDSFKNFKID